MLLPLPTPKAIRAIDSYLGCPILADDLAFGQVADAQR